MHWQKDPRQLVGFFYECGDALRTRMFDDIATFS